MSDKQPDLLYGEEHAEHLTHEDPLAYAESVWDGCTEDEMIVRAHEYRRVQVSDEWLEGEAERLMEAFEENWGEEFGPFDDQPDMRMDRAELVAVLRRWSDRSNVWRCEPTGRTWDYRFTKGTVECVAASGAATA